MALFRRKRASEQRYGFADWASEFFSYGGTTYGVMPYQTLTGLFDGMLGGINLVSTHAYFAEADVSIPGGGSC